MMIQPRCGARVMQLAVVLLLLGAAQLAHAYSCGDPANGHCYGKNRWYSYDLVSGTDPIPVYFGAFVDITQVIMSCPSGCGGFVTNELWLVDDVSPDCKSNEFKSCWVETGTIVSEGNDMDSFWAEARPRVRNTFNVHYFGPPDRPGTIDHFMIVKDKRVHALGHWMGQPYMVFITNDHGTLWNTSTAPLLIVANRIDIGTELAGSPSTSSDAASVDRTDFTRNLWAVKPLDNAYVFWYRAQSKAGEIRSDNQSLNLDWTPSTRVRLLMMADRSGSPNRAYNCIQVGPTP